MSAGWRHNGVMNQLTVNQQQAIIALHEQGWSGRRIAREFGVDRKTVRRYLQAAGHAKSPTNPRTGSNPQSPKSPTPQTGALALGGAGPDSLCEPWKDHIQRALAAGLSIQRIYQDLVAGQQFAGSYDSVWRFVRRLEAVLALPFRRIEVEPGAELQVDFGQGAWVIENGKRKRTHLFRAVLGHSRKGYSEATWRQTTEAFNQQDKTLRKYLRPDLLIIDDMGLKALPKHSGEYLLEVVMRRYENRSTIMTSNRPLEEWGKLLGDVPTAGAILDRFLHHTQVIAITGKSYRVKDTLAANGEPRKTRKNTEPKESTNSEPTEAPAVQA